jgi:hypothetical protein
MAKKKVEQIQLEGPIEETTQKLETSGLGDVVKSVTDLFGIPQCDECKHRQEEMNRLFPWLKAARPLELGEVEFMKRVTASKMMLSPDVDELFRLYNDIFPSRNKVARCNCPGLVSKMVERIMTFVP